MMDDSRLVAVSSEQILIPNIPFCGQHAAASPSRFPVSIPSWPILVHIRLRKPLIFFLLHRERRG